MKQEIAEELIKRLESGEYKKGRSRLRSPDNCFCVLGVLADIIDPDEWRRDSMGEFRWHGKSHCPTFGLTTAAGMHTSYGMFTKIGEDSSNLVYVNDISETWEPVIAALKEHYPEM